MNKKIKIFPVFLVTLGLLTVSSAGGTFIKNNNGNDIVLSANPHDFGVIGSMEIDGSEDYGEMCTVEMSDKSFVIDDYNAGDLIRFSADYEIVKDLQGPWDEAPYTVGPTHHPTTIEKWDFVIKARHNRFDGEVFDIGEAIVSEMDCPWDIPPEILIVKAPSSVVEGEDFGIYVTFQGMPTYKDWGNPEEVTFNGETKNASEVGGFVSFTAPEVDEDTQYTIDAVKDWGNVDDHHPNDENVLTYGETKITVLNQPDTLDLVVVAPSSVMEKEKFEVLVRAGDSAVPLAAVIFNGFPYVTNLDGKVNLVAPEVSEDEEYTIYANLAGFIDGETKMTVHSDYDDESDSTDETGITGTVTLELSLTRSQFYRPFPSPDGRQTPIEIEVQLRCYYEIWNYKGYPHWGEEEFAWDRGYLSMTLDNDAPSLTVDGPTSDKAGVSHSYTAIATDPDGDPIHYYEFLWGDGDYTFDNNDHTGFNSGEPCTHFHTWSEKGQYTLWVCAEDAIGDKVSYSLPVEMPKSRLIQNLILLKIMKKSSAVSYTHLTLPTN